MTEYDLIIKCENQLGWVAPRGKSLWKSRAVEVAKLKKAMTKAGVTLDDLAGALEMSRRQHRGVDSPVALVYRVEESRAKTAEAPTADIAGQVQDALDFELEQQLPGWELWVSRLSRCSQAARREVFNEWASQRLVEVA